MGSGELSRARLEAAERYDRELATAVLLGTARRMIHRADIRAGMSVLDVGCGTGVVARECLRLVGSDGSVTGLDISLEMLVVASTIAPGVGWVQGDAMMLPFPPRSFDRVVSQFTLMFVPDPVKALDEMWRVLRPGGRLTVSVSGALRDSPVNLELAELVERHVGRRGRGVVEEIWTSGPEELEASFARAGITNTLVTIEHEVTEYPSIQVFVESEVRGWAPLSELVDDETLASMVADADHSLIAHLDTEGRLRYDSPYYMVAAVKD